MPITVEFKRLYDALNDQQKKAVDTIDGPVMVLAGPGTGKTQTLVMRIANILRSTEMDPWNILCLTFTESGVAAMRSRLLSIIGTPAYYIRIHTFHSFCNEILQDHPEIFAKGDTWRLVSDAEKVEVFQTIVEALPEGSSLKPFYAPYLFFTDVMKAIGDLKQEDISPQAFMEIIRSLATCFDAISGRCEAFFACTVKQRTYEVCQQLRQDIRIACTKSGVKESIAYAVDQMFTHYDLEQSKARTQLKNAVKKWFTGEGKNIEKNKALAGVYAQYEVMLAKSGMYDYEDMISRCVAELKSNDVLLAEYQEQFQYILVDEYQDTNGGQNEVVELLGSFDDSPNIFVVGDDKQSIYRFQGASLANMLSFYERYKKTVAIISLTENYRSQKTIIDATDALIAHNTESLGVHIPGIIATLVPGRQLPERDIAVFATQSEDQEAYIIGENIKSLVAQGSKPEDIAVLYRYNRDGEALLETLRTMDIPARIEMGENIFAVPVIRQWIVLLRWLVDGASNDGLARIVQYGWWDIDPLDALKAIHYAGRQYIALLSVLSSSEHLEQVGVIHQDAMLALTSELAQLQKDSVRMPIMEFLQHIMKETRWMNIALDAKDCVVQLRAMKRFLNEAKELTHTHIGYTTPDFVQHLLFLECHNIDLLTPSWEGGVGAVHLMSAHKAKGLQWPHVFVMHMNDKHWGNLRKRSGIALPEGLVRYDFVFLNDRNEDERRLLYVAMTRAMLTCTLTRATHTASGKETVPSIFLSEIPEPHIVLQEYAETPEMQEKRLLQTMVGGEVSLVSDDAKAYIRSQMAEYVMSVTHLNNYLECPRKFYWRNILQIPSLKTRSLMLGSAMHDTLRDVFEIVRAGKAVPNQVAVQDILKKHLLREPMSETDFTEIFSRGSKAISGYMQEYTHSFGVPGMTEHNFKKYKIHVGDVPITGKLDKIEIIDEPNKQVNVVDYKTGNSDHWREKLRKDGNYVRQMIFYKLLCDNAPQFGYTMVSGEFDFVEKSKTGFIKKKIDITQEDIAQLTQTITRVWQEIQELRFMDKASGCGTKECEYCN